MPRCCLSCSVTCSDRIMAPCPSCSSGTGGHALMLRGFPEQGSSSLLCMSQGFPGAVRAPWGCCQHCHTVNEMGLREGSSQRCACGQEALAVWNSLPWAWVAYPGQRPGRRRRRRRGQCEHLGLPLPPGSQRRPLLRCHGSGDELAAGASIARLPQPLRDDAPGRTKDAQKELRIPVPSSFLLRLHLAELKKERIACAGFPGRNLCGGRARGAVRGSDLGAYPGRGGRAMSTCRGGADLCEKVTSTALLCEYWPRWPLAPSAENVFYRFLATTKICFSLLWRGGIFYCASSFKQPPCKICEGVTAGFSALGMKSCRGCRLSHLQQVSHLLAPSKHSEIRMAVPAVCSQSSTIHTWMHRYQVVHPSHLIQRYPKISSFIFQPLLYILICFC